MHKSDVREPLDALEYLLDCSLATVCGMADKKSRSKSEYKRQIAIAQINYDWCVIFGSKFDPEWGGQRADSVAACRGSVETWAIGYEHDPS